MRALLLVLLAGCTQAHAASGCVDGALSATVQRVCDLQNNVVCYYVPSDSSLLVAKGFNHAALSCVHL